MAKEYVIRRISDDSFYSHVLDSVPVYVLPRRFSLAARITGYSMALLVTSHLDFLAGCTAHRIVPINELNS
jgi:hypothetical protein